MKLHSAIPAVIPADLKYTNRFQVLDTFLNYGTLSASDISGQIGLSRQTVMKSIQFFLHSGLLVAVGKGTSTKAGGKRPELYALSNDRYFLCITLWPMDMRLHLYTIGGHCVDQRSIRMPLPDDPRTAIDTVGRLSDKLLSNNQVAPEKLCAVSLSTPGIVDYETSRLKFSSQTPGWGTDIPLVDYLKPYFSSGTQFFLENAGKMAARPFLLESELADKRVLTIFTTWGLSSCLIEENRILSGKNSLIGEIGHMIIAPDDPERCGCGSKGCLERMISMPRLHRIIRENRAIFPESELLEEPVTSHGLPDVFAASAKGDRLARYLVSYLASSFAAVLRSVALVFDPDLIVFQGDYAYADTYFDSCLKEHLKGFQYFPSDGPFDIRYDQRSLEEMDAMGSYIALVQCYFDNPARYADEQTEEPEEEIY